MADEKDDFLVSMMQTAPAVETETEERAAPEVEAEEQEQKGEAEQVAATATTETVAATPAAQPAKTEAETVPIAAVMDERRKRQALERQLAELTAAQQKQPTDFYQNPEQHIAEVTDRVAQQMKGQMYAALEFAAKRTFPDYDEKFAVVEEFAKQNPAAIQDIFSSPNPAVAAYELGQRLIEYREMQNPETYRAKIEAELRTKLEAEYAAKAKRQQDAQAAEAAKAAAIPPDLSTSASASANTRQRETNVFTQLFPSN
jgi:hypothetical protein